MSRSLDGGPVLSGHQVRVAAHPFKVSERSNPEKQPTITLGRDGDRIREIHIHCHCGEKIILDCEYLTESKP